MNFTNGLGWPHLLILALVVVVVFGSKRLPDTARSLGRSMRILKAETKAMHHDEDPSPASAPTSTSADEQAKLTQMQQQVDDLRAQLAARQDHQ